MGGFFGWVFGFTNPAGNRYEGHGNITEHRDNTTVIQVRDIQTSNEINWRCSENHLSPYEDIDFYVTISEAAKPPPPYEVAIMESLYQTVQVDVVQMYSSGEFAVKEQNREIMSSQALSTCMLYFDPLYMIAMIF